mmetsp:Transcript_26453/g.45025  ORF Transcript_26453/g.45025 Transcript_26453/m.45025 type:complete len:112 (+) Transcript_26453:195-530(+)
MPLFDLYGLIVVDSVTRFGHCIPPSIDLPCLYIIVVNVRLYTNCEIPNADTAQFELSIYKHPKQLTDFITKATPSAFAFVVTSICCKHLITSGSDKLSTKEAKQYSTPAIL